MVLSLSTDAIFSERSSLQLAHASFSFQRTKQYSCASVSLAVRAGKDLRCRSSPKACDFMKKAVEKLLQHALTLSACGTFPSSSSHLEKHLQVALRIVLHHVSWGLHSPLTTSCNPWDSAGQLSPCPLSVRCPRPAASCSSPLRSQTKGNHQDSCHCNAPPYKGDFAGHCFLKSWSSCVRTRKVLAQAVKDRSGRLWHALVHMRFLLSRNYLGQIQSVLLCATV